MSRRAKYGIYIPIWLDLLYSFLSQSTIRIPYLHSNMVRFIIGEAPRGESSDYTFTFQYG